MEIDIDLTVFGDIEPQFSARLGSAYLAIRDFDSTTNRKTVKIKYSDDASRLVVATIGEDILVFLSGLDPIAELVSAVGGELRLGVYYDIEQTVGFPAYLSAASIQHMAKLNISLDATGYPCSD